MKLLVTLDRDEDGVWVAECPAIPGCVSQGAARKRPPKASAKRSSSAWKCAPKGAFLRP